MGIRDPGFRWNDAVGALLGGRLKSLDRWDIVLRGVAQTPLRLGAEGTRGSGREIKAIHQNSLTGAPREICLLSLRDPDV